MIFFQPLNVINEIFLFTRIHVVMERASNTIENELTLICTRRVRVLRFIKLTFKPENALFITSFLQTVLERNLVELAEILISTYLQRNGIML